MSTQRQQRNSFFGILIGLAALAVFAVIGITIYTLSGSASTPSVRTVAASDSVEPIDAAEPTAISAEVVEPAPTEEAVEAAVVATEEPEELVEPEEQQIAGSSTVQVVSNADIRFGVAPRSLDCGLLTEAAVSALSEQLSVSAEIVMFDSADSLFEGIVADEADMTLCFVDPEDRSQISGDNNDRLGYLRQVGSAFWNSGEGKLQIWSNGAAKSDIRDAHPCALHFLEEFTVADGALTATSAADWLSENADDVESWTVCNS